MRIHFDKLVFFVVLAVLLPLASANAVTFNVLYKFSFDGYAPAGIHMDGKDNLFVTPTGGGLDGVGTMIKFPPSRIPRELHDFRIKGVSAPNNPLLPVGQDRFAGTAQLYDGSPNTTVYTISRKGHQVTVLHEFDDGNGAAGFHRPALIADKFGNLYGALTAGGAQNLGMVYKLAPDGTMTVLHSFAGGSDGAYPYGGVIADKHGNLYGTTYSGGTINVGTVFKLTPNGTETILHNFTGDRSDGARPVGALIIDKTDNLYGTASTAGPNSGGVIFKMAPGGAETILHSFNPAGGYMPIAGLLSDKNGNLYGTTTQGANDSGAVYRLSPDGSFADLYNFTFDDGVTGNPIDTSLVMDKSGNLYGVTNTELYEIKP